MNNRSFNGIVTLKNQPRLSKNTIIFNCISNNETIRLMRINVCISTVVVDLIADLRSVYIYERRYCQTDATESFCELPGAWSQIPIHLDLKYLKDS